MSKTFNRAKLRKLVEAGKVTLVSSYHFDDMSGENGTRQPMPVAMRPEKIEDRKQGVCYLLASDFTSGSGRAWSNQNGTVTLYVHSNSNYDFRIAE